MGKNYWMTVSSQEDFEITKRLGFSVHGLGRRYRRRAQRMQQDDRVLVYVSGIRKWAASATITSRSYEDHSPIWMPGSRGERYPYRVKLAPEIVLNEEDYIDALILAPRLEYLKHWAPEDWPLAFQERLHLLPQRDFRLIEGEMKRNIANQRNRTQEKESQEREDQMPEQPELAPDRTQDPQVDSLFQPATDGSSAPSK